jgi:hypothetical protein
MEMLTNTMKRNRVGTKQFKVWEKNKCTTYMASRVIIRVDLSSCSWYQHRPVRTFFLDMYVRLFGYSKRVYLCDVYV